MVGALCRGDGMVDGGLVVEDVVKGGCDIVSFVDSNFFVRCMLILRWSNAMTRWEVWQYGVRLLRDCSRSRFRCGGVSW